MNFFYQLNSKTATIIFLFANKHRPNLIRGTQIKKLAIDLQCFTSKIHQNWRLCGKQEDIFLKDDFPVLDVLILPVTHTNRQNSIDFFQHLFNAEGVPLVN